MPSKKLFFALTLAVSLLGVAVVSRPTAHATQPIPPQRAAATLVGLCYHTDFSDYYCPGSDTSSAMRLPGDALGVDSVWITVAVKGGRTYTNKLPASTDAIFLSNKSLKTFLLLHYLATDDKKFNDLLTYINSGSTPSRAPAKAPPKKP
jgi:hypothetical protein